MYIHDGLIVVILNVLLIKLYFIKYIKSKHTKNIFLYFGRGLSKAVPLTSGPF